MINKIKEWGGLVALIAIVLFLVFGRGGNTSKFGTVSPTDGSATNFTEVTASNGMYIGGNGLFMANGSLLNINGTSQQAQQSSITSTTTVPCIIPPPTATSTLDVTLNITQATTTTTAIGIATTTNPYATSTLTSLLTTVNGPNGTQPIKYSGGNNMFVTPGQYVIFFYTNGTTGSLNAANPQGQGGTCNSYGRSL